MPRSRSLRTVARAIGQRLPSRFRQPLELLGTMNALGAFSDPSRIVQHIRHRGPFRRLSRALFYHRYATAILLAHQLGLFRALEHAKTALETTDVARMCGANPNAIDALCRVLQSEGFVERVGEKVRLTDFARTFLSPEGSLSISPLLDLMVAHAESFAELVPSMQSGKVPSSLDIFSESGRYVAFVGALNEYLAMACRDLLAQVELPKVRDFIVGSMGVSFSRLVLDAESDARVTFGCLPHLTREIPRLCDKYAIDPTRVTGMHAHSGDPTADQWGDEAFDLIFLTKKLNLVPEERIGEKFARKAFDVLRPGGMVIFWETVHADRGATPLARAMEAVLDLGASPGARVFTEAELANWLVGIGYSDIRVVPCLMGQTTFVVASKRK